VFSQVHKFSRAFLFAAAVLAFASCSNPKPTELRAGDVIYNNNSANGKSTGKISKIAFGTTNYNFGKVVDGTLVKYSFSFKNVGEAPLVIAGAQASCGCTIPDWPREPIAPGDSGVIKIEFNSKGRVGKVNKTVTVTANTEPSKTELNITGDVMPAIAGEAKQPESGIISGH